MVTLFRRALFATNSQQSSVRSNGRYVQDVDSNASSTYLSSDDKLQSTVSTTQLARLAQLPVPTLNLAVLL